MNNSLKIREAAMQDIGIIRQIAEQTWPETYGGIISEEQIRYMLEMMYSNHSLEQQLQSGHRFYLAEAGNQIIGFASVSDEGGGVFKLNKLYVLPSIQKTGAGKALLQQAMKYAKSNGAVQLILQVNKQNNARQFYERQGLKVLEEKVLELEHGFVMDDYIMGIHL
ncbi:MAG: GNAT family N-acetyltransferase [Sediminibacterium sp.]|nr:GNAT family N-acetyltransferase [Sediminibacterium sp.]